MIGTARQVRIEYEGRLASVLTKNRRSGPGGMWRVVADETAKLKKAGYWLIREQIGGGDDHDFRMDRATVHIHQFYAGNPLDFDSLAVASAGLLDAFVAAGVLVDDSPKSIAAYHLSHERVAHRDEQKVVVTVSEA